MVKMVRPLEFGEVSPNGEDSLALGCGELSPYGEASLTLGCNKNKPALRISPYGEDGPALRVW